MIKRSVVGLFLLGLCGNAYAIQNGLRVTSPPFVPGGWQDQDTVPVLPVWPTTFEPTSTPPRLSRSPLPEIGKWLASLHDALDEVHLFWVANQNDYEFFKMISAQVLHGGDISLLVNCLHMMVQNVTRKMWHERSTLHTPSTGGLLEGVIYKTTAILAEYNLLSPSGR